MAKATIDTGTAAQPVHTRTTSDSAESQAVVISIDGSDNVVGADTANGLDVDVTRVTGTVTTAPTTAGDVVATLTNGRKVSTSVGTAVALRATLACKWVTVSALPTNTGKVWVGGLGVLGTVGSETGVPLAASDTVTIPVADAASVFVDVLVSGEGVAFVVGS